MSFLLGSCAMMIIIRVNVIHFYNYYCNYREIILIFSSIVIVSSKSVFHRRVLDPLLWATREVGVTCVKGVSEFV